MTIKDLQPRGLQPPNEKNCVSRCFESLTGIPKERLSKMLGLYPGMCTDEIITAWEMVYFRNVWVNPDWEMIIVLMAGNIISGHAILRSIDEGLYWDPYHGYLNQLPKDYLEIKTLKLGDYKYIPGRSKEQVINWLNCQSKHSYVNMEEIHTLEGIDLLDYLFNNLPLSRG